MNTIAEKFTVPAKNEKWRFSGLKELALGAYEEAHEANNFRASAGVTLLSGRQLTPADRQELTRPLHDMGSRVLEQQTNAPEAYGVVVRAGEKQTGEAHLYATAPKAKSCFKGRVLAEVAAGGHLTIVENVSSQSAGTMLVTATRLKVAAGATLDYICQQEIAHDSRGFNFLEVEADKGATVNVTILNLGSGYVRQEVTAVMKGEGAVVNLRSLSLASGEQEIDQRTLQIHEAPNAKSDLLFKNIIDDKARTIFSGLIRVAPGAQKTDAYQKNRNLLLSEEAQANSLPGLEIEANDVRCTHGATCGKLSDEELFYLRARGIGKKDAQRMLVGGYAEEILAGLPEDVAAWARAKMEARVV